MSNLENCYHCGSTAISTIGVFISDDDTLEREVICESCKETYKEFFKAYKNTHICDCLPNEENVIYDDFPEDRSCEIKFKVTCNHCDNRWDHIYIYSHKGE